MVYGDIDIINEALIEAKCPRIGSINEKSEAARVANQIYPMRRDELLAKADWGFARMEATMSPTTNPSQMFKNAYIYPPDCLAFRYFVNPVFLQNNSYSTGVIFASSYPSDLAGLLTKAIEDVNYSQRVAADKNSKVLVTNLDIAVGIYTAQITNASLFSEPFRKALTHYLAAGFADSILHDDGKKKEQLILCNNKIADAEFASGREETEQAYTNNPLLNSRD